MNYEEIVQDTQEMIRHMELKWDIISGLMIIMMAVLIAVGIRLIWEEHRDRQEKSFCGAEYRPTVTEDVQIIDGVEWHRMGVPEGR